MTVGRKTAVMVAAGMAGGIASAASRPSATRSGVEHTWTSDFNPKTFYPTVFVGSGLFTDAGKLIMIPHGDKVTLSRGTFELNNSKVTAQFAVNAQTCFLTATFGGYLTLHGGTAAYAGISGKLQERGKIIGVLPRRKSGKCNESNNTIPLALVGEVTGSGKVTLGK